MLLQLEPLIKQRFIGSGMQAGIKSSISNNQVWKKSHPTDELVGFSHIFMLTSRYWSRWLLFPSFCRVVVPRPKLGKSTKKAEITLIYF